MSNRIVDLCCCTEDELVVDGNSMTIKRSTFLCCNRMFPGRVTQTVVPREAINKVHQSHGCFRFLPLLIVFTFILAIMMFILGAASETTTSSPYISPYNSQYGYDGYAAANYYAAANSSGGGALLFIVGGILLVLFFIFIATFVVMRCLNPVNMVVMTRESCFGLFAERITFWNQSSDVVFKVQQQIFNLNSVSTKPGSMILPTLGSSTTSKVSPEVQMAPQQGGTAMAPPNPADVIGVCVYNGCGGPAVYKCPNVTYGTCKAKPGTVCSQHIHVFKQPGMDLKMCKTCADRMIAKGCDPVTGANTGCCIIA